MSARRITPTPAISNVSPSIGRTGPVIVSASADHVTRVVVMAAMGIASQAIIRQFYRIASALTALPVTGDQRRSEQSENIAAMDHGSFRDQLLFAIGFAVSRSRDLL